MTMISKKLPIVNKYLLVLFGFCIPVSTALTNVVLGLLVFLLLPKSKMIYMLCMFAFLWNSGMFMFRAQKYIEALEQFQPDIIKTCRAAMENGSQDMNFIRVDKKIFLTCPDDSIDYAVMEKTDAAAVVPLDAGWCDVGSWTALWEICARDDKGNACKGPGFHPCCMCGNPLNTTRICARLSGCLRIRCGPGCWHPQTSSWPIPGLPLNLSNFEETFGRTVLEAMAAGHPGPDQGPQLQHPDHEAPAGNRL
jgi:hypothetical protein